MIAVAHVACGDSKATPAAMQADVQVGCPATLPETIGVACVGDGRTCGPEYTCGVLRVSLLCVCTGGVFECTDGTGNKVDAGTVPACPASPHPDVCPASERNANLASCNEQGLTCAYPSACASRVDQCQCFPGATLDGGFGLRFDCIPATCAGFDGGIIVFDSGSATDAGADAPGLDASQALDSGTDATSDSRSDGPNPTDALASDARSD
ncbi:MAG: hypothetical protein M3O46_06755 [Myxococcota bacterium]|nr:hypothetical protein [Myxococcota bacterium]